jgi:hypothetical protein
VEISPTFAIQVRKKFAKDGTGQLDFDKNLVRWCLSDLKGNAKQFAGKCPHKVTLKVARPTLTVTLTLTLTLLIPPNLHHNFS